MTIALRRDEAGSGPIVTGIERGRFRTQEHYFADGVMLTPRRAETWAGTHDAAQLTRVALDPLLAIWGEGLPEFIVLGTGTTQVFPAGALRRALEDEGIGIEVMDSRAAARAWSVLRAEDREIAALLLPLR